ncbi:MAG: DUF4105 domain-containing protein [Bacteroidaceae bacterium]|nr:DUF4105 domain-containing protein [Bacteroidaceae bacterium]
MLHKIRRQGVFLFLTMLSALMVKAQSDADSINHAAQDEDFVRASLLTVGPGNDAVTCFGHAAIRMQCPSAGLDYCFTFEMKLDRGEYVKFLTGDAKAGFMAARTEVFLEQYRQQGRGIHEYDLNLLPRQEQELWRNLDIEVGQDARWDYDFIHQNCGSMCVWIMEKSLLNEHIEYGELPPALTGTYHETIMHVAKDAPWLNLYFHVRHFYLWNVQGDIRHKMDPGFLVSAWQHATFTDEEGHHRPIFLADRELAPQTAEIDSPLLTPTVVLIAIIILTLLFISIKKRKLMKKIFTSLSSRRMMLTAAVVFTSALNALAGGEDWYAYKVQMDAYPTGAGVVYADTLEFYDESEIKYAESIDLELTTTKTTLYGYAKPNDGWQFIGFAKDQVDEEGNVVRVDEVTVGVSDYLPFSILSLDNGVGSTHYDETTGTEVSDDSLTVSALMPLEPNNYFRALFTHVYAKVDDYQKAMGSVSIDKLINNIGDQLQLTATPASEFNEFVNWTVDGEVVSNAPTVTVDVKGVATYEAHFSDSRTVTLHFPEEGGFIEWYSIYDYDLNYQAEAYSPFIYDGSENNYIVEDGGVPALSVISSGYAVMGKVPAILYGYGDVTINPSSPVEAEEPYSTTLFKWSGEDGIDLGDLSQENDKYYTFDTATGDFSLVTSGTIAANKVYMQLPDSLVAPEMGTPETLTLINSDITGISSPAVEKATVKGGIYDLMGRRLDAIRQEGIYIVDGKKVIYRKK